MGSTIKQLDGTAPTHKVQTLSWSGAPNVYYRIQPTDHRSWVWRGTLRGKPIWVSMGDVRDSRINAKWLEKESFRLKDLCSQGIDPRKVAPPEEETPTPEPTMEEAFQGYLASRRVGLSVGSVNTYSSVWTRTIAAYETPAGPLGTIRVGKVRMEYVDGLLTRLQETPGLLNLVQAILSKFWKFSVKRHPSMVQSPVAGRDYATLPARKRRIATEDLRTFGDALRGSRSQYRWFILYLLLTGARRGLLTHWDPSFDRGDHLLFDDGVDGLKGARWVILGPAAQAIQPGIRRVNRGSLDTLLRALSTKAGLPALSPHDLRRTYVSFGIEQGVPKEIMMALTSHTERSGSTEASYVSLSIAGLRPFAEKVESALLSALGIDIAELRS